MSRGAAIVIALLAPILVALQGATFAYVVSIERRLTRLETLQGLAPGAQRPREPEIPTTGT